MKHLKKRWARVSGCGLILLTGFVVQCEAQVFNLNNGNSVVAIDASPATAGMMTYLVNGINQVKDQWFYYRVGGGGPENPIQTLGALTWSQSDARTLDLTYSSPLYSARVVYTLTGGTPGTGTSSLNQSISFLNKTGSSLSLSFFDYSDFDLDGVAGGQSLAFSTTLIPSLRTNKFTQTFGSSWLTTSLNSGTNFPSHVEAALFSQTLGKLQDGVPSVLNDVLSAGIGDVTGAFEWDATLPANGSLSISKLINMQVLIPEPSVLSLLALGLVAALYRRSRT